MNSNRLLRAAHRSAPSVQIRAIDDAQGRFQARVMHYNVVDDYRTIFQPGLFRESLETRLPRVVWAHDWAEPLGRYIDYDDTATHLDLIGEFDNFDDVPRARQAYAQLKSGTIDEFSVGFMPLDGVPEIRDGEEYFLFTRARLDEVSLVLSGAVPNTQLLAVRDQQAVRSPVLTISKDFAAQTILDLHSGKIDLVDALQHIKTEAVEADTITESEGTDEDDVVDPPVVDDGDSAGDDGSEPVVDTTVDEEDGAGADPESEQTIENHMTSEVEVDFSDVDALVESILDQF